MIELPCISMYNPWALWVMKEWKTIETRTHKRFRGLVGKRIAIAASLKYDDTALVAAASFLTPEQLSWTAMWGATLRGYVLCTAFVEEWRELHSWDSKEAMICCDGPYGPTGVVHPQRWGLKLVDVRSLTPAVPVKGNRGIFKVTLPDIGVRRRRRQIETGCKNH